MTLREWMDKENVDIIWIAAELGVSTFAVKKWLSTQKNNSRRPRQEMQQKIFKLTKGKVAPNDWLLGD